MTDEETKNTLKEYRSPELKRFDVDKFDEAVDAAIKIIEDMTKLKEVINDYHNVFMVTNPCNTYEEIPVIRVSDLREILKE